MTERHWKLGNIFVLRHAGFPFDWLERLGWSDAVLQAADQVLAEEERLIAMAREAQGQRGATRVAEALHQGRDPGISTKGMPEWPAAFAQWQAARQTLEQIYNVEYAQLRAELYTLAADDLIQDAVFLSNPAVYENTWQRFLAAPQRPDNAHWRRIERTVYTYLQRFCGKNETTSFFGPMGYGEIDDDGDEHAFEVKIVPKRRRRTFLSFWAVGELARVINRERDFRLHLPLRWNTLYTLGNGVARSTALEREVALDDETMRFLHAHQDNASLAVTAAASGVARPDKVVAPLLKAGILLFGIVVPADTFETLQALQEAVADLPDSQLRASWLERLVGLRTLLDRFAASSGAERRETLDALEKAFTTYTGLPARRGEGQIYADRLVIYEEANSQFALHVGQRLASDLARQLSGGLELSAAYGENVQNEYHRQMLQLLGNRESMNFLRYAMDARPDGEIKSQFSPLPALEIGEVSERSVTLAPDLYGTSTPGGRYALPDVCIMAPSPDAIARGQYSVILGRVHHHLLLWSWLSTFYPNREVYDQVARTWLEQEPTAQAIIGLELSRRNKAFYSFPGRRTVMPSVNLLESPKEVISAGDLKVVAHDGKLELHTPDGQRVYLYLALADYPTYPPFGVLAHPLVFHVPMKASGQHMPRLYVGESIYQRERWTISTDHLTNLHGIDLLLAIQRERRLGGWPRFVFARLASERKPHLIDLASPFGHELLRHLHQDNVSVTLEEMVPGPDELWLRDEKGRYTCELRMQVERWSE